MRARFPQMWKWTSTSDAEEKKLRLLRNASAHGIGTTPTVSWRFSRQFSQPRSGKLWDIAIEKHVPLILDELSDLIVLLVRELPSTQDLEPNESQIAFVGL